APQQAIDDPRRATRASSDLERAGGVDLDLEQARRTGDDSRELFGRIELEPRHNAESVAQWVGQHSRPGRRADQREWRQVELHAARGRAFADHDVDLEILER